MWLELASYPRLYATLLLQQPPISTCSTLLEEPFWATTMQRGATSWR